MRKPASYEVYPLRLSPGLRPKLEAAAKAEGVSVDAILTRLARTWLAERDAEEQRRLRERVMKAAGTVSIGGPSATNAEVRKVMGEFLEAKYRESHHRPPPATPCPSATVLDSAPSLLYVCCMNKVGKIDKGKVYRWRLSPKLKKELEAAAKDEATSIDTILARLVREWLAKRTPNEEEDDEEHQRRLHERGLKAFGKGSVDVPTATNAEVRKVMGEYLEGKYRASQLRAPRRSY
jgi:hypothetical protein